MSKPKAPKEDPSTILLRERQAEDLIKLDEQQNQRIKQMLANNRGGRFFRGSPASRSAPSNTAGPAGSGSSPGASATGSSRPGFRGIVRVSLGTRW